MLFILNSKQETVGVANNGSPFSMPYFEDTHTENLEGVNTYEFSIPSEHEDSKLIEVEGHVIVRNLDGENMLFTIKEVQDSYQDGSQTKYVYCEDTAITELLSDVQRPAVFNSATLEAVATSVIANSGDWTLAEVPLTGSWDVEFTDYITVLEALRQLMTQYNMEMYFTVELQGTKIVKKVVNIVEERGLKSNVRFDYHYDLKSVSRTEDSSQVVTALIGVGKGDEGGKRVTLVDIPAFTEDDFYKEAGGDWIGSESALQLWGRKGRHRFGVFIDEDSDTPERLKKQTLKELAKRIVPDVTYGTSISNLERLTGYEGKKLRLGDQVLINDKSFSPPIVITGRVKELKRSYTRNDVDEVNLGNYKPVTLSPNIEIKNLQKIVSKNEQKWEATGSTVEVQSLGGTAFRNGEGSTKLLAKVFNGGNEIDLDGSKYLYKWYKYTADGVLVTKWGGTTDYRTGKYQDITSLDVTDKNTFVCKVETK